MCQSKEKHKNVRNYKVDERMQKKKTFTLSIFPFSRVLGMRRHSVAQTGKFMCSFLDLLPFFLFFMGCNAKRICKIYLVEITLTKIKIEINCADI